MNGTLHPREMLICFLFLLFAQLGQHDVAAMIHCTNTLLLPPRLLWIPLKAKQKEKTIQFSQEVIGHGQSWKGPARGRKRGWPTFRDQPVNTYLCEPRHKPILPQIHLVHSFT
jgi:hypothetical protein